MEDSSKKSLVTVIVLVVVVVGGYYLLNGGAEQIGLPGVSPASNPVVQNIPKVSNDQLLGKAPVDQAQQTQIETHKQEILTRVRSSKPLTQEEKSAIGNIMLTQAHLYKFNDAERQVIFDALRK